MAYPNIGADSFIFDLLQRQEFYALKLGDQPSPTDIDELIKSRGILRFRSHQEFVRRFMHPCTPYTRFYVKHGTGQGKTLLSLFLAREFIKVFKIMHEMNEKNVGSVVVIGFNTKPIFYRELLRFPEFGYIRRHEIQRYNALKILADRGGKAELEQLKEFRSMIIRRLYKRQSGGFFKFFGYKEFVNKLFSVEEGTQEDINFRHLDSEQIRKLVKQGKLVINQDILDMLANSYLICDEIHNVYNSMEKNNYGIALQTVLDLVPTLKAIFLSATPFNNLPTEYVDLQNLLLPPDQAIKKSDFFTPDGKVKPSMLPQIAKLMRGRVSFFRDDDPAYFPSIEYQGEPLSVPLKYKKILNTSKVPYLKFIRCPMSPLHYKTYQKHYQGVLSIDNRVLDDMVFPNPDSPTEGLFNTMSIKKKYKAASQKWLDQNKIEILTEQGVFIISGNFLRDTLDIISSKYQKMMDVIFKLLSSKTNNGKILIYHPFVTMSGILLIREIFRRNGIVDLHSDALDDTPCSICGIIRKDHKSTQDNKHEYKPVRFIIAHGGIDRNILTSQRDRFNSPENPIGEEIKIIIGSNVIKEGFDFKGIQHLLVMMHTVHISELIQIIGRGARHESHMQLPPSQRVVNVYLFVSALLGNKKDDVSHEEYRYIKKMADHLEIQKIEKVINAVAVDANIHRDVVMPEGMNQDNLVSMYFKPDPEIKGYKLNQLQLSTFYAFYADDEIRLLKYIIKRLFVENQTVWTYGDLWKVVRNPPFPLHVNPNLFIETSFVVALSELIWDPDNTYVKTKANKDLVAGFIDQLFASNREILTRRGQSSVIVQVHNYYMLVPIITIGDRKIPNVDVETCYRDYKNIPEKRIRLKKYIAENDNLYDYDQNKIRFHARYNGVPINKLTLAICEYNQTFHIRFLEDAIEYVFKVWTSPGQAVISEYHDFYFRMVYFYTSLELVVYAGSVLDIESLRVVYQTYLLMSNSQKKDSQKKETDNKNKKGPVLLSQSSVLALLQSSLDRKSRVVGCIDDPKLDEQKIKNLITESKEHHEQYAPGRRRGVKGHSRLPDIVRVDPVILPIGHILDEVPRMYAPEKGWFTVSEYMQRLSSDQYKENDIIIGYYEKSKTGLDVKFKLRSPIQKIKIYKDTRLIERGSVCTSNKKQQLMELSRKLGIKRQCSGIRDICDLIRIKLIENEISERRKGTKIKWFYHLIEKQPMPVSEWH